jgi:NTP pyrophosphatase (non-canonical NTP hydrolase)
MRPLITATTVDTLNRQPNNNWSSLLNPRQMPTDQMWDTINGAGLSYPVNNVEFMQHVRTLFVKPENDGVGQALHAAVGASGEAGEMLDAIKKTWVYGRELDARNVLEECGDQLFYIVALLNRCGFHIEDAMAYNMSKLAARYPEGYTDAAALARADKREGEV